MSKGQKQNLVELFKTEIVSALGYLEYSHKKIQSLTSDPGLLDAETLETWESFVTRFARVTDIFVSKYMRARVSELDPAFRGELRDYKKSKVIGD